MIPYDELVVALATWRAKQGLPVATPTAGSGAAAAAKAGSGPTATSGSGPTLGAKSGSGPARTTPPGPAPRYESAAEEDVDDAALLEEASYEGDYQSAFDAVTTHGLGDGESTSIGAPPAPRDSFGGATSPGDFTIDESLNRGGKKPSGW